MENSINLKKYVSQQNNQISEQTELIRKTKLCWEGSGFIEKTVEFSASSQLKTSVQVINLEYTINYET